MTFLLIYSSNLSTHSLQIILIAQSIQEGIQVRYGIGTHLWDLLAQPGALVEFEKV